MSDKKTKIECRLTTSGTEKANEKVVGDLSVPDPDPAVGEKVIKEVMEEDIEDESQSENS